ncbi:MAG: hypothetical protein E7632_12340 [Ruminococcaceae bacterium]|nr:hypothetical protein [Oscillospiraceae bacterium]
MMNKIITYETLRQFCYSNDKLCKEIRGIVICFAGLNCRDMYEEHRTGTDMAKHGIVWVFPYNNPWCWMNEQAVAYTDELIDVLMAHYNLPDDLPIVAEGGSMGGMAALTYMVYAKRTPVACVANCPVCDLPYHFTERPDLPRTLYSAFWHENGAMEDILPRYSPLHLVDKMPDADYTIFHCEEDKSVNKQLHSDKFVAAMAHRRVEYIPVPGRGHGQLTDEMWERYYNTVKNAILNRD